MGLEADSRIKSWLLCLWVVWPWAIHLTSLRELGYNKGIYLRQLLTKYFTHSLPDVFQPFVKLGWDHVIIKWEWDWRKSCDWPPFFLFSCCDGFGGHVFMEALDHVLPEDTRRFPVDTWHFLVAPPALERCPVHIRWSTDVCWINQHLLGNLENGVSFS